MKNIKVTSCLNCPFMYPDFDPDAMGLDTCLVCVAVRSLGLESNSIIACYNEYDPQGNPHLKGISIPEWCPLKKEAINVEL